MLQFESYIIQLDSEVWSYGFEVSAEIATQFDNASAKRVLCTLNDTLTWHTGIMPKGENTWFIKINKEQRKQLNLEQGSKVFVTLVKDNSKYGMPICDEMEELLAQDTAGSDYFHALTPGKQRNLLYVINKPKNGEIRLNKAITILEYLKSRKGHLDFKELNKELKTKRY